MATGQVVDLGLGLELAQADRALMLVLVLVLGLLLVAVIFAVVEVAHYVLELDRGDSAAKLLNVGVGGAAAELECLGTGLDVIRGLR